MSKIFYNSAQRKVKKKDPQIYADPIKKSHLDKINFNKFLCKPIELNLKIEDKTTGKLSVVEKDRSINEINDFSEDQSQGLLSQLKYFKTVQDRNESAGIIQKYNIRLMICITVYNEGADQLEKTLKGVEKNLQKFKASAGIQNQEIAVVIIYDGIDKMNNETGNRSEENMLKLFDIYDYKFKIDEEYSMRSQYNKYKENVSNMGINVDQYFKKKDPNGISTIHLNKEASLIFREKEIKKIQEKMEQDQQSKVQQSRFETLFKSNIEKPLEKGEQNEFNGYQSKYYLSDKEKESLQKEALKELKKQAKDYVDSRRDNAWLYQVRGMVLDDEQKDIDKEKRDKEEKAKQQYEIEESDDSDDSADEDTQLKEKIQQDQAYEQLDSEEQKKQDWENVKEQIKDDFDIDYLNIFFCAKYRNAKKLNSHLWFFKGFCETLDPDYVVLLDCGLEPDEDALYQFFTAMEADKNIGGVCGFMGLRPERNIDDSGKRLDAFRPEDVDWMSKILHSFFDIQKAQVFEYNFAHIIDKAFESLFGFIHVLPGAFSAYRYSALTPYDKPYPKINENNVEVYEDKKESILDAYLKTELDPSASHESLSEANMYLAEDRILCLSLFCHFGEKFTLKYVPTAHALVDPVMNLTGLLGQRRRWINGSWFALNHVLSNYTSSVKGSKHGYLGLAMLFLSMQYARLGQFLTYFAIALYFSAMLMIYTAVFENTLLPQPDYIEDDTRFDASSLSLLSAFIFVYFMIVGGMIFFSLQYNHANKAAYSIYYGISTILGIYMLLSFGIMLENIIQTIWIKDEDEIGQDTLFSRDQIKMFEYMVYVTVLAHAIPVLMNPCKKLTKIWELLVCTFSFLFYMPTYIHMFIIFSFCRIDDLSWGTKGSDSAANSGSSNDQGGQKEISEEEKQKMEIMKLTIQRKAEKLQQSNENQKFNFFFKWIILNMLFSFAFSFLARSSETQKGLLLAYGYGITGFTILRSGGAILFYVLEYFNNILVWWSKKQKTPLYMEKSQGIKKQTEVLVNKLLSQGTRGTQEKGNKNAQHGTSMVYNIFNNYKQEQEKRKQDTVSQIFTKGFLQNNKKGLSDIQWKTDDKGRRIPQLSMFGNLKNQENDNQNQSKSTIQAKKLIGSLH